MDFWKQKGNKHQQLADPPTKRISTPAGQRLSVIVENGDQKKRHDSYRGSLARRSMIMGFGDPPRESFEDQSHTSSGYSYNVWAGNAKFHALRNHEQIRKRGGWKRIAIIIAIILALIIALAVGLAVGLKKKKPSSTSTANSESPAGANATPSPGALPTGTAAVSPAATPSNFPVGSYSLVTFLDTVQTNCTSNPDTWTCYPYTIFNTDTSKSVATFNWIISSPSPGKYQISSTDNPFSISFKNRDLELLDAGESTEHYRFQISQTKTVKPSSKLTEDNADTQCDFSGTSLQAFLYTKMARSYPDTSKGEPDGSPSFPVWPFAVRVEQAEGGGQGIPSCYKLNNGNEGDQIADGFQPQDPGQLCSCLYKNWRTPTN